MSLIQKAEDLRNEFAQKIITIKQSLDAKSLDDLRVAFVGKKGFVTELSEGMRTLEKELRPAAGKTLNELREFIESQLQILKTTLDDLDLQKSLTGAPMDVTLPGRRITSKGSLHPVSLIRQRLISIFKHMGFTVFDGPEVDLDFYNFGALNFPEHHPARDMQDTFFLNHFSQVLMRTHTSNVEIHTMLEHRPPLRAVSFGRTYRCDSDLTHTPMFHQMECLVVDRGISFAHLKGQIHSFLREVYGSEVKTRFRPSFFPFVEPGAEVDIQCASCEGKGCKICKNTGWIEIGGCGMTHPNVFEAVGYDSEEFTGFAFGFGLDRMAMNKFQLPDLRQLFAGESEFLSDFPAWT